MEDAMEGFIQILKMTVPKSILKEIYDMAVHSV